MTIRPQRRARMPGRTASVHRNADFRFTAIPRSKSSSRTPLIAIPALFTKTSIGPSSPATRATISLTCALMETSARAAIARPPAERICATTDVRLLGARLEIDRNRGAALGQRQCDRPADAARGACDQGHSPLKINHFHPPLRTLARPACASTQFV